ncbi:MAG: PDZ domain-containing protein [Deltaproteobacteria bacterium]|nr:PDZ domain-containing protein [Deltaproteobacteria bacterium]
MKNKLLLAGLVAAVLPIAPAALLWHRQATLPLESQVTKASLDDAAASLDEGPVPVTGAGYDLSAHQTLSRVVILIKENYVEPERIQPYPMLLAALDYIQKTVPEVMVDDSEAPKRIKVSVGSAQHSFDLERLGGLDQLWEVTLALRDVFRFIQSHIADPERQRDIEYAAINGMLSTLDPHSVLLKPESFDEVKLSTKGEFGGLGIVISIRDGALTIISPIEGTPAARAGLKAKDQIVKIGEESTVNMNLEEAVQRLRGKPGTKVNVWILRKSWTEPRRYSLTRANIKIESVSSESLDDGIGYVKIKSFQANTFDDLDLHLEKLKSRHQGSLKGLVLDLRNNPGGLLDQAILVSDRFVDRGPIVITVGEGNRKRDVKTAHVAGTDLDYPIAVLVNGGSASASEIVAGALKNLGRAIVIGQQTFGKGSVQVLYDFKDRSALKLTIAQYLTPGDLSIQSVGITPDVQLVPATISKDALHVFVEEDGTREKDLDRHLDTPTAVGQNTDSSVDLADLSKPVMHIVHLAPVEAEPAAEEAAGEGSEAEPDKFKYDFEIHLAHDVLVGATSRERKAMLQEARPLFAARGDEEEKHIVDELGKLGVDWTTAAKEATARVEATLQLKGGKTVAAGTVAVLQATVKNVGDGALCRVYGVTSSENPLFKNLEFPFGRIAAGATKRWEVSVKLPQDLNPRADLVTLSLGDLYQQSASVRASTMIEVAEVARPSFSYRYWLDDRRGGNGDGLLQPNEDVDFKVVVLNNGRGKADDVTVAVKNLAAKGVFLKKGREKVGVLKPGSSKEVTLEFALKSPEDEVGVRLSVWDATLGEALSEEVKLPVAVGRKAKPERAGLKVTNGAGAPVYAGADDGAPVIGQAKAGAALKSDASFAGFYRVLGDGDAFGFVKTDDVKAQGGGKGAASTIRWSRAQAAPVIALERPSLITREPTVRLSGSITDERHLKDVFIFVNDKKVYYQSLDDQEPGDQGVRAPFDVTVTLKTGENGIAIVARESKDLVSRTVLGLYREPAEVVAEVPAKKPVAQ